MRISPWVGLFAAGLTRSMQFTSFSTLAFADIPPAQRSSSSTIFNMFQQLAIGFSVAAAALTLDLSRAARSASEVGLVDFHTAFFVFGVVALAAIGMAVRLPRGAGAEVSGHRT